VSTTILIIYAERIAFYPSCGEYTPWAWAGKRRFRRMRDKMC
jgi:hypothetical protein